MDALDLARWQFGITTVYHFLFVPITIGLSAVVAWFHTRWVRHHDPADKRLAKFLGKLFMINFALGLVTGIVQEFQFGMNWSDYSRFVGDVFGAPLAVEALLAFFLESTFLGVWLFGWGRIPERLHAATMWLVHIGTVLSAYFILAANSFMQNPVGYQFNPETGRAEMVDFVAVLTNPVQRVTFPHTITAAYMTAGAFVMGVAIVRMRRGEHDAAIQRRALRAGAWLTLVAAVGVVVSGDAQAKIMTEVQPMKMAAAEALYDTTDSASFSLFTIGSLDGTEERFSIRVPGVLSFMATGSFDGEVEGINDVQAAMRAQFAGTDDPRVLDDTYTPNIPAAYWLFRLMIGTGMVAAALAGWVLWRSRRREADPVLVFRGVWWQWIAIGLPLLPLLANSFGWMFTELGRQPWVVFGLMTTATGVSPSVSAGEVLLSMVSFTLLYGVLAAVEVKLLISWIRRGPEPPEDDDAHDDAEATGDEPLAFAY